MKKCFVLFSRHWKTGNEGDMGNNLGEPNNYPSFLHGESFQAMAQGEGSRWSLGGLPELKRWSWEFRETKVTRFHRTEYWKGESCTEKKFQSSLNQSAGHQTEHSQKETTQGRKKTHPKGLEGTILRGHTELKIVSVPISQTKKFITHRALGKIHKDVLPQKQRIINPKQNPAPDPPHKP